MSSDATTDALLKVWAEHRAVGRAKGIDSRDNWQTAPEWAHAEADWWVRTDLALRGLVGMRLADTAIEDYERTNR